MYKNMTKEEKERVRKEYYNTKKGRAMANNLNRLVFEGVFCLITSVAVLIAIFVMKLHWWYWFFFALTLICGLLFLGGQFFIRNREFEWYVGAKVKLDKKKLTKKK